MFGRDPVLPLNTLLEPKVRYLRNDINILSLEAMKNMYEIVATNLKMAREKKDPPKNHKPQYWCKITLKDHLILSILVIIVL